MAEENSRIAEFERRRLLVKSMTLESDIFLSVALEDLGACEDVLQILRTYDIFGIGKTVYDIQSTIKGTNLEIDNGLHIKYVNTSIDDGTKIAKLMRYFHDGRSEDKLFQRLVNRANCLKGQEGVVRMCEILEREYKLGEEKGINALIQTLRELQLPEQLIQSKVMEKFSLSEEAAKAYLKNR